MRDLEARTGLNRETVRVYLRHGLMPEPSRSGPNVADYDESHVTAALAVRDLQRDSGLTLRQIKNVLNGQQGERRVEASAFQHLEALVATRVGVDDRLVPIASLLAAFPHAERDAKALEGLGMVTQVKADAGWSLCVTDTRLVTLWGEMRAAGFTEATGFPPEILSYYLQPAEFIADREATLFLERTEGKIDEAVAAQMLQIALRLMLDFFGLLRMKAFLRRIHRDEPRPEPPAQPVLRPRKAKGPPR